MEAMPREKDIKFTMLMMMMAGQCEVESLKVVYQRI